MEDDFKYENAKINDYKDYLDHILDDIDPNIQLDDDQRRAVVSNAERALVIAGAGTGKTTTMVARVKYLVDKMHVDPKKILVLSFARKNVRELRDRIQTDLNIDADVSTFHALGLRYLRQSCASRGLRCYIVDERDHYKIFEKFLREEVFISRDEIISFYDAFKNVLFKNKHTFRGFFRENYDKFSNFEQYSSALAYDRINEWGDVEKVIADIETEGINDDIPRNIRHEWFRSKGEAAISNFLIEHNIKYEYEKVYEEILPEENLSIKPDFTLNIGGSEVIVEYFGLCEEGDDVYFKTYQKEKELKIARFQRDHKKYIALEYEPNFGYLDTLKKRLMEFGFSVNKLDVNKIAEIIIRSDPLHDFWPICQLFNACNQAVKASTHRKDFKKIVESKIADNSHLELQENSSTMQKQSYYISKYIAFYKNELRSSGNGVGVDYSDMIYFAKDYIITMDKKYFSYEHVLIDEYQDISLDRYHLTWNTLEHCGANLMAIGDDWQSIYGFTGSKIEYTYKFHEYYREKCVKTYKIGRTYRFSDQLAKSTGLFIRKNPDQIPKELYSYKNLDNPVRIRTFSAGDSYEERIHNEASCLASLIKDIHLKHPDDNILVLARSNYAISKLFEYSDLGFIDEVGNRVKLRDIGDYLFDVRTIHKSKGATSDWTIVFGLSNSFPHEHKPEFWFLELFRFKENDERIQFAEERRVFYVALTRTKNCVFLLECSDKKYRSSFIEEILDCQQATES